MKEIGGFFELETANNREYHSKAIRLNLGRNCLEYIIKLRKYKKLIVPVYICNSIINVLRKNNINYAFYNINNKFEPIYERSIGPNEALLYVNYFGINKSNVVKVIDKYEKIIIDNTQAFFEEQIYNIDTFYSARKFIGVPDGGYLYIDSSEKLKIDIDTSYHRFQHLVHRKDMNASIAYKNYLHNEKLIDSVPMKAMSNLTKSILNSIDYERMSLIRERNFLYLHSFLNKYNLIDIDLMRLKAPMIYPFVTNIYGLKEYLISNNIYIATYWEEVLSRAEANSFERTLVKYLLPLPIDQRYTIKDMSIIMEYITKYLSMG